VWDIVFGPIERSAKDFVESLLVFELVNKSFTFREYCEEGVTFVLNELCFMVLDDTIVEWYSFLICFFRFLDILAHLVKKRVAFFAFQRRNLPIRLILRFNNLFRRSWRLRDKIRFIDSSFCFRRDLDRTLL